VADELLLSPGQVRIARIATGLVLAMLTLGTVVALVTYPSWQLGLALVCVLAAAPLALLLPGRMRAPLQPGVPARAYLASAGLAVGAVALIAAAGVLFSQAPIR